MGGHSGITRLFWLKEVQYLFSILIRLDKTGLEWLSKTKKMKIYLVINSQEYDIHLITIMLSNRYIFALLAFCAGNAPVTGEFPTQRPMTRGFNIFFDLCLSKQSWDWWFETASHSLWRHCNGSRNIMESAQKVGIIRELQLPAKEEQGNPG